MTTATARGDAAAVVKALLSFAAAHPLGTDELGAPRFTRIPAANQLVAHDPFAFLIAIIFDEGIPAERAWTAPYRLKQRLGYLDPERILADPEAVSAAIAARPMLHRFVARVADWVIDAADRVLKHYSGDASRLWRDEPTTAQAITARFEAFPGIGEKKAGLAIEVLAHDLGAPIRALSGADVPFDIHVRRVFIRTGLVARDDLGEVVNAGRRLNPREPGALGMAAVLVGRHWCRPSAPMCSTCPIASACPKLIDRARGVTGA